MCACPIQVPRISLAHCGLLGAQSHRNSRVSFPRSQWGCGGLRIVPGVISHIKSRHLAFCLPPPKEKMFSLDARLFTKAALLSATFAFKVRFLLDFVTFDSSTTPQIKFAWASPSTNLNARQASLPSGWSSLGCYTFVMRNASQMMRNVNTFNPLVILLRSARSVRYPTAVLGI